MPHAQQTTVLQHKHSTASRQSVESRFRFRISLEKQHTTTNRSTHSHEHRGTYVLADLVCSLALFPCCLCLWLAFPCLVLPFRTMPCTSGRAMPCHATTMPCPCLSLVAPNPPSLRLTFPQSPVQPSRRSAHKQDFTWVSELLQPKCPVPYPVLPCPVLQSRCPTCPASLSICKSANLSLPRDLVSVCDARFDSLCLLCFAFQCFALRCWPLLA